MYDETMSQIEEQMGDFEETFELITEDIEAIMFKQRKADSLIKLLQLQLASSLSETATIREFISKSATKE